MTSSTVGRRSGTCNNEFKAPAEHVFDVATLTGSDLWMVGSAKNVAAGKGGAAAYRSTDGGTSWSMVASDTSITEVGRERYYWAAALNGKMYMQAEAVQEGAPLRVFDGTTWTTMPDVNPCYTLETRAVEVFKGKILCTNYSKGVVAFDGTRATTVLPTTGWNVLDFDIPGDGFIYGLSPGAIYRSADGMTWTALAKSPDLAWAIGVHQGTVYVGQRLNGTIVKLDGLNATTATGTGTTPGTTTPCKGKSGKIC